uniref:Uncharacterized protein n=1 Tax=Oryza barthii TaxID=65489 RepID=A0A0D3HKZ4_9ORYZ
MTHLTSPLLKRQLIHNKCMQVANGVVERRGSEDGGESGAKVDGAGGRSRRHTTRRQVTSKFLTSCEPWLGI